MKILRKIVIWLVAIFIIVFGITFALPTSVYMERSITINSQAEIVFDQLNNFKNMQNWSPWHDIDTTTIYTYNEIPEGVGASYKWKSNDPNVGSGMMTIIKSKPFEYIETELDFNRGNTSLAGYKLEPAGEYTKLIWWFAHNFSSQFERYMGLIFEIMLAPDYEKGLENIKEICENMPSIEKTKIEITDFPGQLYIGIKDKCPISEIGIKMGEFYGELMGFVQKTGIQMTKPPFSVYFSEPTDVIEFAACIPIEDEIKTEGRIIVGKIKKGKMAVAKHFGNYNQLPLTYQSITNWIMENNKTIVGPLWEEYITDPMVEKDTSKWLTKVYFPIE